MKKILKNNTEIILFLVLIIGATIATIINIHNMVGLNYTFNTIFFLLILYLYGKTEAYTLLILINLVALFFFDSSFICMLYVFEIFFIGYMKSKKQNWNLVLIDIMFWAIITITLCLLTRIFNNSYENGLSLYYIFNIAINGIINVLIVELILTYIPFERINKKNIYYKTYINMNTLLFHISIGCILFILVLNVTMNSVYRVKDIHINAKKSLISTSHKVEDKLESFTDDDIRKLKLSGTLQIGQIKKTLTNISNLEGVRLSILNIDSEVIVSNKENVVALEKYNWKQGKEVHEVEDGIWEIVPVIKSNSAYTLRWYNSHYVYEHIIEDLGLVIVAEYPVINEVGAIVMDFNNQISFMLIMGVSVFLLALIINKLFLKTMTTLADITTDIPFKLNVSEDISWPKSRMAESKLLIDNFKVMTKKLEESHKSLEKLAYYDLLTGLLNRTSFKNHLESVYKNIENQKLAVIFIDINGFKQINDTLGHNQGDNLLKLIASRLGKLEEEGQKIFRLGGDEFVVVAIKNSIDEINETSKNILEAFKEEFILAESKYKIGASIGVSIYPDNTNDIESLTKNADIAMYKSKRSGGDKPYFYTDEIEEKFIERIELEEQLKVAIENEEFYLVYQPKINLQDNKISGAEVLIRWNKEGERVTPQQFISVAEEARLITKIDEWVIKNAFKNMATWKKQFGVNIPLAINISAKNLENDRICEVIDRALMENEIDAECIKLEITESVLIKNIDVARTIIQKLKARGLKISIDDFGYGYSSLNQLINLQVDEVKIDRSFIVELDKNKTKESVVKLIIELVHTLNMNAVAEGVETKEELECIKYLGCDEVQGYVYSKPLNDDKFIDYIINNSK